jgi:hypothetical protein
MQIKITNSINKRDNPSLTNAVVAKEATFPQSHRTLNADTVNFTGLNRNLSKMAYESLESIKAEVAIFPKSNGIVGNLPDEWIQKIPKENRANTIKEFYRDLKAIISDRRSNMLTADKPAAQKLNEAFIKAGIIKNDQNVEFSDLGYGLHGRAFRLKGLSDDKYIIKVFKSDDALNNYHGKYIEPNRAAFWKKYAGKNTQMTPFYFADAEAGYMVNKYIDKQTPKFKKNISPEFYGLKSVDICDTENGLNKINGFQIDYGGIEIVERNLVKNKGKQADFRKYLTLPKEKQLESLDKADDTIKMYFLDKLKLQPEDERPAYFEQIFKKADEGVKIELADKLDVLPEEKRVIPFKQLTKNASDNVKMNLACNFYSLPEKDRLDCFKLLAEDSSEKVKLDLVYTVNYIPKGQQAECYKLLTENSSEKVKKKIGERICYLPRQEWEELTKFLNESKESGL